MDCTRKLLAILAIGALGADGCASGGPDDSARHEADFEIPLGCGIGDQACPQDEYCRVAVGACREAGARGTCAERPAMCAMILAPVCGCDEQTYPNACEAARAGMNVWFSGACGPFLCGGSTGSSCPQTHYCSASPCGALGLCVPKPTSCDGLALTVCGCDFQTYESACVAHTAGVEVDSTGNCPAVPWVPSAAPERLPPHSMVPQVDLAP